MNEQCRRCGDVVCASDMGEGGICNRCWLEIEDPDEALYLRRRTWGMPSVEQLFNQFQIKKGAER